MKEETVVIIIKYISDICFKLEAVTNNYVAEIILTESNLESAMNEAFLIGDYFVSKGYTDIAVGSRDNIFRNGISKRIAEFNAKYERLEKKAADKSTINRRNK